jgi:beta-lactamase class A
MKNVFILITTSLLTSFSVCAQIVTVPTYYQIDEMLSKDLYDIVLELDLDHNFDVGEDGSEQISFAVIDLNGDQPKLGGVNYDNFIYPASVYKMYVAAEILNQVSQGKYSLYEPYVAKEPNVVDRKSEIKTDPRPLLKDGDTVNVNYLLDLMITRSDNSAANCLIDIAQRRTIDSLIHSYGWYGSEVTRKFLKRKFEDPGYENIRGTETCALHAADFMYKIYSNTLVNEWVSLQMKTLLGRQLDKSKLAAGLPSSAMFYHKTGWFSYWTNDVGIVIDGDVKYIIACFMPIEEELALPKFKVLSEKVYELMKSRK